MFLVSSTDALEFKLKHMQGDEFEFVDTVWRQKNARVRLMPGSSESALLANCGILYKQAWITMRNSFRSEARKMPTEVNPLIMNIEKDTQVVQFISDLAIISTTKTALSFDNFVRRFAVWRVIEGYWQPIAIKERDHFSFAEYFDIDGDGREDLLVGQNCCGSGVYQVLLGTNSGNFDLVADQSLQGSLKILQYGPCQNLEILWRHSVVTRFRKYTFDCQNRRLTPK